MERNLYKYGFLSLMFAALSVTGCGQFNAEDFSDASESVNLLARKPFGTCDRKTVATINLCMEATGADYNEAGYLNILKASCESSGGVFSTDNCASTESFGTCIVEAGQPNMTYVTYYAPTYTATSAQVACEGTSGGVYLGR